MSVIESEGQIDLLLACYVLYKFDPYQLLHEQQKGIIIDTTKEKW